MVSGNVDDYYKVFLALPAVRGSLRARNAKEEWKSPFACDPHIPSGGYFETDNFRCTSSVFRMHRKGRRWARRPDRTSFPVSEPRAP